jgi:hypothetical protein
MVEGQMLRQSQHLFAQPRIEDGPSDFKSTLLVANLKSWYQTSVKRVAKLLPQLLMADENSGNIVETGMFN